MVHFLTKCVCLTHIMRARRPLYVPFLSHFSTSSTVLQRRQRIAEDMSRRTRSILEDDMEDLWDQIEEPSDIEDSPSVGHLVLQQQRLLLNYMRLIEHEMPKLVAFRKPFIPPTMATPLIVRSLNYQGEPHPVTIKRVIVAALDELPLKGKNALHKFKLLAGPRWTPVPPADAGVSDLADWGNGFIKISCEDFPKPSMNLKWASDTLNKLISEANDSKETFSDLPVDLRHSFAKAKKAKKGDHIGNRVYQRPSIRDFPQEWLPQNPA